MFTCFTLGISVIIYPNDFPFKRRNYIHQSHSNLGGITLERMNERSFSDLSNSKDRSSTKYNEEPKKEKPNPILSPKVTS